MNNPFWYGNPVPPQQLIGRQNDLRKLTGRITTGQSTALIGPPQSGKTSILHYLMAPENQASLYQQWADKLIFSYLDAYSFLPQSTLADFWKSALSPLQQRLHTEFPSLVDLYQSCQNHQFDTDYLKILFAPFKKQGGRLVLFIDGFDIFLGHSMLNSVEFFGGLRALASTEPDTKEALVLVISGNTPISQLHEQTRQYSRRGSPYFNFMEEIFLGALSDSEIDRLLQRGAPHFTPADCHFIKTLAGGHPYLLQVAASLLWDLFEHDKETDSRQRQQRVERDFYPIVANTLLDTWQSWTPKMQETFVSVTMAQLQEYTDPRLHELPPARLEIDRRISELQSFTSLELTDLERYGWIVKAKEAPSGWRVKVGAFLSFVVSQVKQQYQENPLPAPEVGTTAVMVKAENVVAENKAKDTHGDNEISQYIFTLRFWLLFFPLVSVGIILGGIAGNFITVVWNLDQTTLLTHTVNFVLAGMGGMGGYRLSLLLFSSLTNTKNHIPGV